MTPQTTTDRLLSISEIARRLGKDPKTIRKWYHAGIIPIREYSPRTKGMLESSFVRWCREQ